MPLSQPYPDLDELIASIGEAGRRLSDMKATEGAAGNISIYIGWPVEVQRHFPQVEHIELPIPAPALAGKVVLVTGSGSRLRDILTDPDGTLAAVVVNPGGLTARMYTSPRRRFKRITGEFNTHLAAHQDEVARTNTNFQALVHAQPPHMVYLSHMEAYRDQAFLNREAAALAARNHRDITYGDGGAAILGTGFRCSHGGYSKRLARARHSGVEQARGDFALIYSVDHATDIIEYAEAAARYEYMDHAAGSLADG